MTNEEAANVLRLMATGIKLQGYTDQWMSDFKMAYEMAIKVLEESRQGKWKHIIEEDNDVECPFCGFQEDGVYNNFCPKCGADMRGTFEK